MHPSPVRAYVYTTETLVSPFAGIRYICVPGASHPPFPNPTQPGQSRRRAVVSCSGISHPVSCLIIWYSTIDPKENGKVVSRILLDHSALSSSSARAAASSLPPPSLSLVGRPLTRRSFPHAGRSPPAWGRPRSRPGVWPPWLQRPHACSAGRTRTPLSSVQVSPARRSRPSPTP